MWGIATFDSGSLSSDQCANMSRVADKILGEKELMFLAFDMVFIVSLYFSTRVTLNECADTSHGRFNCSLGLCWQVRVKYQPGCLGSTYGNGRAVNFPPFIEDQWHSVVLNYSISTQKGTLKLSGNLGVDLDAIDVNRGLVAPRAKAIICARPSHVMRLPSWSAETLPKKLSTNRFLKSGIPAQRSNIRYIISCRNKTIE